MSFAKDALGATALYLGGRPDGVGDHLLMTPDKNPNRAGLQWIAEGLALSVRPFRELVDALGSGSIDCVYAIGAEAPNQPEGLLTGMRTCGFVLMQATNHNALTALADVLLPASTHIEDEGSFVNLDGIVQRFRRAYPPLGESQPHWTWASALSRQMGLATMYGSAREVFRDLAGKVKELSGFDWDRAAPPAQPLPGLSPAPAGADGRPPGYREWGVPRVRGL